MPLVTCAGQVREERQAASWERASRGSPEGAAFGKTACAHPLGRSHTGQSHICILEAALPWTQQPLTI